MNAPLEQMPILAGLDEAALAMLSRDVVEARVAACRIVIHEGEVGNRLFLIAKGSVRICKNYGQRNEAELARLHTCDFFGEMCILETLPRCATVQALEETFLYSLSSLTFNHLYQEMPSQYGILVLNIARDLSRRLRHLDEVFAAKH